MSIIWNDDGNEQQRATVDGAPAMLDLEGLVLACAQGREVTIPVKGWTDEWPCEYRDGRVRAYCPTANIDPIVERKRLEVQRG